MRPFASTRRLLTALVALAVVAVPVVTATGASAGTTGGRLRPESFYIAISETSSTSPLWAYGPVRGYGTDTENSNGNTGVFNFGHGNTVNVDHTNVNNIQPKLNYRTCTETEYATGWWTFNGGTGRYRYASGYGRFAFSIYVVAPRHRNGQCNFSENAQPVYFSGHVTAWGYARR